MLECIKFGDCKIKTIKIEGEWLVSVRHIGIALGVGSDTLKGIVRYHLPTLDKFSIKENNIDDFYDGCKLFTTKPGTCRVMLGSTHPYWLKDIIIFKIRPAKYKKQGISHFTIVYLQPNIIGDTFIL